MEKECNMFILKVSIFDQRCSHARNSQQKSWNRGRRKVFEFKKESAEADILAKCINHILHEYFDVRGHKNFRVSKRSSCQK